MADVNKAILIGRLGSDPEIRYTNNGTAVANFQIATTERWTRDGEKEEKTEWHRIVAWKRLAEICGEYLTKGSLIYVEGRLQTREWEKDGIKRYATEIVIQNLQMLGGGSGSGSSGGGGGGGSSSREEDDDIPF